MEISVSAGGKQRDSKTRECFSDYHHYERLLYILLARFCSSYLFHKNTFNITLFGFAVVSLGLKLNFLAV